jgi:hypothetical protein
MHSCRGVITAMVASGCTVKRGLPPPPFKPHYRRIPDLEVDSGTLVRP